MADIDTSQSVHGGGIVATWQPVDWNPPGLPDDPAEVLSWLVDPVRRGELYPLYHQLRRLSPVYRTPPHPFHGAWAVTRFTDADIVFRDGSVVNDPAVVDQAFAHGDGAFTDVMRDVMVWQEPEPHQRVRNLVKAAFTQRAIARWRPIAEHVAGELCDTLAAEGEGGEAELVSQYNYELPFNIIARILGIPDDDFPRIKRYAWDFARAGEKFVTSEVAQRGDDAARALVVYFGELGNRRRAAPCDDLISSLVKAEADGERLTQTELIANCILLLQAGHETTQDLLGNAEVALFRYPEQLRLLRRHPELTKAAVEEFLRYDGSVQINHRVALEGVALEGEEVPPDAMLYVFLGAVNRDPERYHDPDILDITRSNTHHLAFSFGAYYCLGAALARTEIAVGIRTLIDRFSSLRPARDTFEWRDTLQLRGPLRLDVTW
jgi:cytochrome P450